MNNILAMFAMLAITVEQSSCACPHDDPSLKSFSKLFTPLKKSNMLDITQSVLLDVELVDVSKITISGSGKLVFGRNLNITVKVKGILVKDQGSLVIGSNDCRHTDYVNIVLEGVRSADQSRVGDEGEKFIAVKDDGELHIHGPHKLSWTKLTGPLDRIQAQPKKMIKHLHSTSEYDSYKYTMEGPTMYVVDAKANVLAYHAFDFYQPNNIDKEKAEVNKLITLLDSVKTGELVAISTQNFFKPNDKIDLKPLMDKLEEASGMPKGDLLLRDLEQLDAYSLIFVKGGSNYVQAADPMISKTTTNTLVSLEFGGFKISASSYIDPASKGASLIDFRILDPSVGYPVVEVSDDISSWSVGSVWYEFTLTATGKEKTICTLEYNKSGDEVLITTTDYAPSHGEVRKIKEILSKTSFRLCDELIYRHYHKIENRVDMRAEVALLTRNIKIEGAMSRGCPKTNGNCDRIPFDSFGGHIKIMHSFGAAHIHGAEFTHMGQATQKGTYPLHFHMLKNITGKTAMVKGNSIHHTFQRCVTVHGTYGTSEDQPGVVLEDNVAYNAFGHCFFLEDGAEAGTILRGNLGSYIRHINNAFFTTDNDGAAAYWITNPKTLMISNVAAGSEGFGIWYSFPRQPVGPSEGLVYKPGEAFRTPIWTFDNNVAHSNIMGGFNFEKAVLDDNGNVTAQIAYSPLSDPLDPLSDPVKVQITRLTVYKNKQRNVWTRGGLEFMQLSSAGSQFGLFMARGGREFQQFAKKGVFLGQSNNGEAEDYPDAVTPARLKFQFGVGIVYGPMFVSDSWFDKFKSAADHTFVSGALGFKQNIEFPVAVMSGVYGLRFGFEDETEGNRMFVGNADDAKLGFGNANGNEISTVRDFDGSLVDCTSSDFTGIKQIVKPEKFLLTDRCRCRVNWKMCICKDLYGSLLFTIEKVFNGKKTILGKEIQIKRLSYSDPKDIAYEDNTAVTVRPRANVILGDKSHYYNLQLLDDFPKMLSLQVEGVESGHDVVVGVCVPKGTKKEDLTITASSVDIKVKSEDVVWGDTLQQVRDDDTMATVFLDGRILYMHFASKAVRNPYLDTNRCLEQCTSVRIALAKQGNSAPCFKPTKEELGTDNMLSEAPKEKCQYSSQSPRMNWGVGDTRASHDGGWGDWGPWSNCTAGVRKRERCCDNPTKFGKGKDCKGESIQTKNCK